MERAIRHGYRRNGELLYGMPSEMYHDLRDADLARLMAWPGTLPREEGVQESTTCGPLGRLSLLRGDFPPARHSIETESPPALPGDSALHLG